MIKILSKDTIQKIAAGEVVERPASIIKELVENSIDAKATDITVEIKNGGKSYIRISDNGIGIDSNEIELAFTRHATSKIYEFQDLYKIYSMGFRGEALSSIIAVAKTKAKTKTQNSKTGIEIVYENNEIISKTKLGMNRGTTIEVFDLFKYIPARLKFLNSDIVESNKITQLMYIFAIGHPKISFTYIKDNKELFKTSSNNKDLNSQILFGKEFIKNNINISAESNHYKINGMISNNNYYKGNRSMQFIYVNNRYIEHNELTKTIEKAYNNLIPQGRFPIYEIHINVDSSLIDINIHPNKQKIKFSYEEELNSLIYDTIIKNLHENKNAKIIEFNKKEEKYPNFYELNTGESYKKVLDTYKNLNSNNYIIKEVNTNYKEDTKIINDNIHLNNYTINNSNYNLELNKNEIKTENKNLFENSIYKGTILNKYLLYQNNSNEYLILVNISRANERILYDKLKQKKDISSQKLVEPILLNLTSKEIEIFQQNKSHFINLGYDIDQIDINTLIIREIPYFTNEPFNINQIKFILDNINNIDLNQKNDYILKQILQISSHKNKKLNDYEQKYLIKELLGSTNYNTSPHGKNIIYFIKYKDFIKLLKLD